MKVILFNGNPQTHNFPLSSLACNASGRTIHGLGDLVSGPGGLGSYTFQLSAVEHHLMLPPGLG